MGKLAKGGIGGLRSGRVAQSFLGKVAKGTGRLMLGRAAAQAVPAGGIGRLAAYEVGANAFTGLFNAVTGQRAIAGMTANSVARVTGAIKAGSKAARPAAVTGMSLLRSARFDYGGKDPTPDRSTARASFEDRSKELAAIAANPVAAQKAIHDHLAPVREVAPHVADELEMLSIAVPMYLYDKMPRDPGTMTRLGKSTWRASDYDIRQFGECLKGACAPVETIEDAMSGRITPYAAHGVRTLFPRLFQQAQQALAENADSIRSKLGLQGAVRLSILFDHPIDSTMSPEFRGFIAEQHAVRAQRDQQAAQAADPKSSGNGSAGGTGPNVTIINGLTPAQQLLK